MPVKFMGSRSSRVFFFFCQKIIGLGIGIGTRIGIGFSGGIGIGTVSVSAKKLVSGHS